MSNEVVEVLFNAEFNLGAEGNLPKMEIIGKFVKSFNDNLFDAMTSEDYKDEHPCKVVSLMISNIILNIIQQAAVVETQQVFAEMKDDLIDNIQNITSSGIEMYCRDLETKEIANGH